MKQKICLDTLSQVRRFVEAVSAVDAPVYITDGAGLKVSAKSLMGALYSMEFATLYCECDHDIYSLIHEFAD